MTKEQLRDYVVRTLGGDFSIVELSSEQVDDSIDDAMALVNNYMARLVPKVAKNQANTLTVTMGPGERGVVAVKCLMPDTTRDYSQMNVFEIMYRMVFPRIPMYEYYMMRAYYEQWQKIRGTDPDWGYDESTGTMYVDCISGPYDVVYVVVTDFDVESFTGLKSAYQQDLKDLATAYAKIRLSRVRGKFNATIPVPGGAMATDAEILKAEGAATITAMEVKLNNRAKYQISPIAWF